VYDRRPDAAEDSGPVDRPCTECAHGETGVAVDWSVDRPEEHLRNRLERSTTSIDRPKVKTSSAQLAVDCTERSLSLHRERLTVRSTTRRFCAVFYLDSEFVSDPNSDPLVSFSLWILWLYKEGFCPQLLYPVIIY